MVSIGIEVTLNFVKACQVVLNLKRGHKERLADTHHDEFMTVFKSLNQIILTDIYDRQKASFKNNRGYVYVLHIVLYSDIIFASSR